LAAQRVLLKQILKLCNFLMFPVNSQNPRYYIYLRIRNRRINIRCFVESCYGIQICEGASALEATIDSRKVNGRYGSDHFPVTAKILMPNTPQVSQFNKTQFHFANALQAK